MPVLVIRAGPLAVLLLFLLDCARRLENEYINNDSIYLYKHSIHNFDKQGGSFYYFCLKEDICITLFKRPLENKSILVTFMVEHKYKPISVVTFIKEKDGREYGGYSLSLKHKWEDKYVPGYFHTLRVYTCGVIIHKTKLFSFIYSIDMNGNISRRRM